jgi:expansin (peptidoglycan-binding protein)
MQEFLKGKKTYIGLAIALAGILNLSTLISDAEITSSINAIFELVGIAVAVAGRYVAKPE